MRAKYGMFSNDGTEFIITRPDTPRPWFNHFGNATYGVSLSQSGGGYSTADSGGHCRLTWYIPRYDEAGRYVYLRDMETGAAWCATYGPMREPFGRFECRHGLGWTTFVAEKNAVRSELTVFVPLEGSVEIWRLTVRDLARRRRRLMAFPFVEWTLDYEGQGVDDLVYAATLDGDYEPSTQSVVVSRRQTGRFSFARAFITCDAPCSGWDANRAAFVGAGRTLRNPLAVERGRCSNTPAYAEIPVGVLAVPLRLPAGGTVSFSVMVGPCRERRDRVMLRQRWLVDGAPARALAAVRAWWDERAKTLRIETPDKKLDRYVNRWLVKHVHTLGATISVRAGGTAFRNYVQDGMGMLYLHPELARARILDVMRFQLTSGETCMWIYFDRRQHRPPKNVDTKIWLVYLTCGYVKRTGDFRVLNERVRFLDAQMDATVLQRLRLVIDACMRQRGRHGLSLVGGGDWNDNLSGMGKAGRGESVWMSMAVLWALREMAELEAELGNRGRATAYQRYARAMRDAINRYAWDGDRYIMGYTDSYSKVGSRNSPQVKLFLLPQVWAVLSGAATTERAARLWRTVDRRLSSEYGPLIMDRPYRKPDPSIGGVTFLAQGMNENGPVYSHATAFKLCADALSGRGNELYADLLRLLPYTHDPAVTLAEPYVVSNFYRPAAVPRKHGATHRSWVTSTPNWLIRAIVEGMMGMRAGYRGITLDPTVPAYWRKCEMLHVVRGAVYHVRIFNLGGVEHGVRQVLLDGRPVDGTTVPYAPPGSHREITVVLGKPGRAAGRRHGG